MATAARTARPAKAAPTPMPAWAPGPRPDEDGTGASVAEVAELAAAEDDEGAADGTAVGTGRLITRSGAAA